MSLLQSYPMMLDESFKDLRELGIQGRLFKINRGFLCVQVSRRYNRTRVLVCHQAMDEKQGKYKPYYPKDGSEMWRRGNYPIGIFEFASILTSKFCHFNMRNVRAVPFQYATPHTKLNISRKQTRIRPNSREI